MRDPEIVLDKLVKYINENIQKLDERILEGKMTMEGYNFATGERYALVDALQYKKNELEKG
jgi:hypothetical protein